MTIELALTGMGTWNISKMFHDENDIEYRLHIVLKAPKLDDILGKIPAAFQLTEDEIRQMKGLAQQRIENRIRNNNQVYYEIVGSDAVGDPVNFGYSYDIFFAATNLQRGESLQILNTDLVIVLKEED